MHTFSNLNSIKTAGTFPSNLICVGKCGKKLQSEVGGERKKKKRRIRLRSQGDAVTRTESSAY